MTNYAGPETDYYALLGVRRGAAEDEVRRAFRVLARRLHPDVNPAADAAASFAAVVRAYDTLIDPGRRRAYDLGQDRAARPPRRDGRPVSGRGPSWAPREGEAGSPSAAGGAATPGQPPHHQSGPYGMPEGLPRFDAPFTRDRPLDYQGINGAMPRSALRGQDVYYTVHLSLEEVARGVTRDLQVPRREVCVLCGGTGAAAGGISRACPTCHGSGRSRSGTEPCWSCGGSGSVVDLPCAGCDGSGRRQGLFDLPGVRFPAGIPSYGFARRYKGEGDPGPRGGPRGELHVQAVVDDQPHLRRAAPESADILSEIVISPEQAAQGGPIEVHTVHGRADLRLPRNVASGSIFTLKGKGLRLQGRFRRGDQRVTVRIGRPSG